MSLDGYMRIGWVCMIVLMLAAGSSRAQQPDPFESAPAPTAEELAWQRIVAQPNTADLSNYLRQYPNGPHAAQARLELDGLNGLESAAPPPTTTAAVMSPHVPARQPVAKLIEPTAQPANHPAGAPNSPACNSILERSQLGEPISDADRAFLSANCH